MNLKKIGRITFKIFFSLFGASFGLLLIQILQNSGFLLYPDNNYLNFAVKGISAVIFALIFFIISGSVIEFILKVLKTVESNLMERSLSEILIGTGFLIIGLIIAFLMNQLIDSMEFGLIGGFLSVTIYILFVYLALSLAMKNTESIVESIKNINWINRGRSQDKSLLCEKKILDTSTIIDGRILSVIETGFLEGDFLLPVFVLEELQTIADSSNNLKRTKGRRGLEIVNNLKESQYINLVLTDKDYPEIEEVDSKLLKLAQDVGGKVVTNDYNLNMVAEVQDIEVLNINELANAVKPVAIPGDTMEVDIIKEGESKNQGLAYLDDGTMIVVEDGYNSIGNHETVTVTSVLQTNAGKMIFAKIDV